ncbi:DUF742 domain-containing protein [Actinoalloteichus spitiensis]|uniref:DUF742 domain-containing protein n=1 Tax=Actinoalloteichus spitiensis TaxID=252394 RepID=UPI0002FF3D38|nr:DUF742 domain-containing protein [Actinoalloteichus spitiensis]
MTNNPRKSARVRPYLVTGGRTRSRRPLLLETLISVVEFDPALEKTLIPESWRIYELCRNRQSIAEISTRLKLPLGVVRVLVCDLSDQGRVRVHATSIDSEQDQRDLLERVLRGLQTIS